MNSIRIRGARTHNLKNVDLDLPRDHLTVITGLSGSGKSSLAFDTLYAEGQRRYVESLSAYARQFLAMMEKPDVDSIEGLSPAISIQQKSTSQNPRSTVGTITEIHDYLRLLYARVGVPHCPEHGIALTAQTVGEMVDAVLALDPAPRRMLLAPVVRERKGEHAQLLQQLQARGFVRVRVDGVVHEIDAVPPLNPRGKHSIEVVVDRFRARADIRQRLSESFETALRLGDDLVLLADLDDPAAPERIFSARYACPVCDWSLSELQPRLFSFNSPVGACPDCDGLGTRENVDPERVVVHPERAISDGAIRGWDRRNPHSWQMVLSLAAHYGFDPDTPWQDLPEPVRDVILNGSGREAIAFRYLTQRGGQRTRRHRFEGIIPNLERRWHETDSAAVREEIAEYLSDAPCPTCGGERLNLAARNVFIAGRSLPAIADLSLEAALDFFATLRLEGWRSEIAARIVREISERLRFLLDVGLGYLTLSRRAGSLSGGEAQRIRLASQIGAGLVGVLYVLDEPSIGLHQRDNHRLLDSLVRLRDLGNTVIVVEHDEDTIRRADHLVDVGPGAGVHGGEIVAQGSLRDLMREPRSITGQFLAGTRAIRPPARRRPFDPARVLRLSGADGNNLQDVDLDVPIGLLTCVTGVSGSGKSTLVNDTLYRLCARELNGVAARPAPCGGITGLEHLAKAVDINQAPIGRTPRSNPATYTGLFTPLRELFAEIPEARARGYTPGRFSFNVRGGRCEACRGDGLIKVEMHFLPDMYVPCDVCHGRRYNRETLEILYKGHSIADVLDMTVAEAGALLANIPAVARRLETLEAVGLGYLRLGQSATTLSGGEAQRMKLARELSRRDSGETLYVLDEPTTGLHFHDVEQLLAVLQQLVSGGSTVVVIEHDLDVIKSADWVIDLGPEGGAGGGRIIATGTPEEIAANPGSHTGRFLAPHLTAGARKSTRKKARA